MEYWKAVKGDYKTVNVFQKKCDKYKNFAPDINGYRTANQKSFIALNCNLLIDESALEYRSRLFLVQITYDL